MKRWERESGREREGTRGPPQAQGPAARVRSIAGQHAVSHFFRARFAQSHSYLVWPPLFLAFLPLLVRLPRHFGEPLRMMSINDGSRAGPRARTTSRTPDSLGVKISGVPGRSATRQERQTTSSGASALAPPLARPAKRRVGELPLDGIARRRTHAANVPAGSHPRPYVVEGCNARDLGTGDESTRRDRGTTGGRVRRESRKERASDW